MTIQSYLVYPEPGMAAQVAGTLSALPGCEVIPAENREVFVLVTETDDQPAQQALEERLATLEHVNCLAMVGGWTPEAGGEN